MRNARHAGLAAVLALAVLLAGCTAVGNHIATDEQAGADREATEAMIHAVLDVHAGRMNPRRRARLVMGSWEYVAETNEDWSQRLADALRGLEEEMMEDAPEAPWLLAPLFIEGSELVFEVYNKENAADCCPTVAVSVSLRDGRLDLRTSDGVGFVDYIRPPQEVLKSVLADEEQYMKDVTRKKEVRKQ